MLFDRAAKGKKSKELKGELKDLKKSLLNAGGEKAYVNEALRDYQADWPGKEYRPSKGYVPF